ncbi:glutathione S-transferase 3-like [Pleurodeles waltl]|uniref:glutathione S-transferase 3-like n=1 Tax=Pleurodeles waltl TaxID=8319 RepID=UPI003709A4F4
MADKPTLYYTNGRGRMEPIRWLLGAAGVEFKEYFVETRQDYERLLKDGVLLFQQVPMVEMDGMRLVQSRAILNYIAAKYNLYGKDLKERVLIDMYVEGTTDLMDLVIFYPFLPANDQEKRLKLIIERATNRYFPVFEKVLREHGEDFLVGNQLSFADVHLLQTIFEVEELMATVLAYFPMLQAFKWRISNIPTVKKFLSGGQRKPRTTAEFVKVVKAIYQFD